MVLVAVPPLEGQTVEALLATTVVEALLAMAVVPVGMRVGNPPMRTAFWAAYWVGGVVDLRYK